jgi:hypothetical protein
VQPPSFETQDVLYPVSKPLAPCGQHILVLHVSGGGGGDRERGLAKGFQTPRLLYTPPRARCVPAAPSSRCQAKSCRPFAALPSATTLSRRPMLL